jgi:hypothetical protein
MAQRNDHGLCQICNQQEKSAGEVGPGLRLPLPTVGWELVFELKLQIGEVEFALIASDATVSSRGGLGGST